MLFVNFIFSKETDCNLPGRSGPSRGRVKGESGWTYRRQGTGRSALPAASHMDRW